ncbi:MAG: penicillin-binding protein 2 [Thermoanaerobaculales bacterium]|nr:penicillin-binding protein 2 [Thermoanaerobaculales bacterium]
MNRSRLFAVTVILAVIGVAVLGRATQVCMLEHDRWTDHALKQQEKVIEIQGPRGLIRSSDGYLLATSVQRWAVQVDTANLEYPELFAAVVSPILGETKSTTVKRLRKDHRYVWLAKDLDLTTAKEIRKIEPLAVGLVPHWTRQYPLGRTAAPIVGFVGREELRLKGRAGLESYYQELLVGEPDRCLFMEDAHGRQLRMEKVHPGRGGYDLELTINAQLQQVTESELEKTMLALDAEFGSIVVLEAHTGNLLALASAPFSNRPSNGVSYNEQCWSLRPVQASIEPGSTMKPFVAAAGLAAGVIGRNELFDCRARGAQVAGRWIRDHADPGLYTIDGVIAQSSNAGIARVVLRIDEDLLWRTFDGLGFGKKPELGFPGESCGQLWPVSRWSTISRVGLALGQELTVSPLQMALAYAAVANGGWLPEPRLVERMHGQGKAPSDRIRPRTRVLGEDLARRITDMLEQVVTEGTGTMAQVPGFRVAGKTGTAQTTVNGTFDDEHHTAWFAGFLPLPEARWVVVVAIENPKEDFWASTVAAPLFATVAEATARIGGVPPDLLVGDEV